MQMEYFASLGDRMPGTTGRDVVLGISGRVPESMTFNPTRRRYPVVAAELPVAMLNSPRAVRSLAADTDAWWRQQTTTAPTLDLGDAVAGFAEAARRFDAALTVHTLALLSLIGPLTDALTALIDKTGVGDLGALSGSGGAEMAIIRDIWRASRGELSLQGVVDAHGFHGPREGEISSTVWREDAAPLRRLIDEYAGCPDTDDPELRELAARNRLPSLQREVLEALPRTRRPSTRPLLSLCARCIPLRGVGKRAFLQALDVARATARRAGEEYMAEGAIDTADDVFYLSRDELTRTLARDARELVAWRRRRRLEFQQLTVPGSWTRVMTPSRIELSPVGADSDEARVIEGIGVSAGIVEGVVRVVADPAFVDVEPDEVLVASTTDPSWSSIMFMSSALVVDIGSALSHAAVVARELGIPCVVNTRTGTRELRTGDRVRVDGTKGTVEVLTRVDRVAPTYDRQKTRG